MGGELREGEYVFHDTLIENSTGNYFVESEFKVEADTIAVPYTLWELKGNEVMCKQDSSLITDFTSCPIPSDAQFITDCFKITHIRNKTLIGNGVEHGSKEVYWLANINGSSFGIIRYSHYYRWSEPIWASGEQWIEDQRIELMNFNSSNNANRNIPRIFAKTNYIHFDDLGNLEEFDFESYEQQSFFFNFFQTKIPQLGD